MKKILVILVLFISFGIARGQQSDTLLRSIGFYLSPALTDHYLSGATNSTNPTFGGSLGFRFINKLKKGFFIESGLGLGLFGSKYPVEDAYWNNYEPYYTSYHYYKKQSSVKELNWMVPFLVGYKTQKGKVRFQGSMGISFNLKIYDKETSKVISGDGPPNYYYDYYDPGFSFGTSMMAIARAGISIPIKQRISIEILPTARYRMFYFTTDNLDLIKSIDNDVRPWSLGLDVGLMISLDDNDVEQEYEKDKTPDVAYTIQYTDTAKTVKPLKRKLLNEGPKNAAYIEYGGNGYLYSLNYERTIFRRGNVNIQARGGAGYAFKKFAVPLGANIVLGTTRKKFEAGITFTLNNFNRDSYGHIDKYSDNYNSLNLSIDPSLAFRLESYKHMFLRLAVMTHYFPISGGLMPGVGVSLGGCF